MKPAPESAVETASKKEWPRWKNDCSGFAHAVADDLGLELSGTANAMVDTMGVKANGWVDLGSDPKLAISYANRGFFVVAGLKAAGHGHVAVIIPTDPGSPYPVGYWGRFGGVGKEKTGINWSWNHRDLPKVVYYAKPVPESH
ncbi:hypothetical protein [Rhodanobacter hydrolyticus]|uniref:NlpC/P60 domain-containing protein n=1 Tax=Rhodanobacter hydrolyticus TaxID=2250595 RepID=A0ABW8JCY2_9GAMM